MLSCMRSTQYLSQKNDVAYTGKLHNLAAFSDQSMCNVKRSEKTKRNNNKEKEILGKQVSR